MKIFKESTWELYVPKINTHLCSWLQFCWCFSWFPTIVFHLKWIWWEAALHYIF